MAGLGDVTLALIVPSGRYLFGFVYWVSPILHDASGVFRYSFRMSSHLPVLGRVRVRVYVFVSGWLLILVYLLGCYLTKSLIMLLIRVSLALSVYPVPSGPFSSSLKLGLYSIIRVLPGLNSLVTESVYPVNIG